MGRIRRRLAHLAVVAVAALVVVGIAATYHLAPHDQRGDWG